MSSHARTHTRLSLARACANVHKALGFAHVSPLAGTSLQPARRRCEGTAGCTHRHCARVCIHTRYIRVCIKTRIHLYLLKMCPHRRRDVPAHAHIHAHAHAHTHTHTHTRTHARTHARTLGVHVYRTEACAMAKLALAHPKLDLTDDRIILHYVRAPTTPAAHTRSRLHRHAHHCCRPCAAGVARTSEQRW